MPESAGRVRLGLADDDHAAAVDDDHRHPQGQRAHARAGRRGRLDRARLRVRSAAARRIPLPTGNVNIDWFLNGNCSGAPAVNSGSIGPLANGQFDATGFTFTVNSAGQRSFKAHYGGDGTYLASDGACEPLQRRRREHPDHAERRRTRSARRTRSRRTSNVDNGDGPVVGSRTAREHQLSSINGDRRLDALEPARRRAGTGSGRVHVVSTSTGVDVGDRRLERDVSGAVGASFGALDRTVSRRTPVRRPRRWVNANIQITPPNATNAVGTNHVLTITVNAINGGCSTPARPRRRVVASSSGAGQLRRLARRCTYTGGGGDRELHGDDHVGCGRHDGRAGDLEHPGRTRPDDHAARRARP